MESKRRRLMRLQGLKGISDEALCAVIREIQAEPVPAISTWDVTQFLKTEFSKVGEVLRVPTGLQSFDWEVANIGRLLQYLVTESASFKQLMTDVGGMTPTTPLRLALYLDGITPGNVLRPDNKRKIWAFYVTFLDFGRQNICYEECWLPLAVLRTSIEHVIQGKVSCAAKALLESVTQCGENGVFLATEPSKICFFKVSNVLADEEGLKSMYTAKGAAGTKPCMLCRNLVAASSALLTYSRDLVDTACTDPDKFMLNNDEDIWSSVDRIEAAAGTTSKADFETLQRAIGFSHCPQGVLAHRPLRRSLRPASTLTYDWMHVFLSNGVANHEVHLLLTAAKSEHRVRYSHLDKFVSASWKLPSAFSDGGLRDFFSDARERASTDTFKCMASELLALYPLLRHFALTVLARLGSLERQIASFCAVCDVIDMLHGAKMGDPVDAGGIRAAVVRHANLHQGVYGSDHVKPKHHYTFHIASQMSRDAVLLDTFVLERKHQPIKRCAQNVHNTKVFERSVMSRSLVMQVRKLQSCKIGNCLMGKSKMMHGVQVCSQVRFDGCTASVGDVVCLDRNCFMLVDYCLQVTGVLTLVGRELQPTERVTPCSFRCNLVADLVQVQLVDGALLQLVHAWSVEDDGHYLVLRRSTVLV